jgi:PAS domain S-box-containing protein
VNLPFAKPPEVVHGGLCEYLHMKADAPSDSRELALAAFLESAPDAMVVVDDRGMVVAANAQASQLFGYARNDLVGQPVEMLVPLRLRDRHVGHRDGFIRSPRTRPMGAGLELYGLRKDGAEFPVEISLSPLRLNGTTLMCSAIRDITERRELEVRLREQNLALEAASLAKDRFLASMSHELRTPLNAIIGFTGTLLMRLPGPLTPEQDRQLNIVQKSAQHLLSLIKDMLDLARIESGRTEVHLEELLVREVADDVISALRTLAEQKNLELRVELLTPEQTVLSDRRALYQILMNLVNNAIKYTDTGSVTIAIDRRADGLPGLAVSITDTGIGIKPEDLARLFQLFEQIDPTDTRRYEGTGLGLYLSRRLASLVGADLLVRSEYGTGTTFTLVLPKRP